MAGTRGIARFNGGQLNSKIMRDYHFDPANRVSEAYLAIDFRSHREILEDTKIDVFIQVNNVPVAGTSVIDISEYLIGKPISTGTSEEGIVATEEFQIRVTGTDTPIGDSDSDVVFGLLSFSNGSFTLGFFSGKGASEAPYTFPSDASSIDFRYVYRTNLSILPTDAIIRGGTGFVEGATDVKAYMNLMQLMKDVYGSGGTLDNDGSANLGTSIQAQITNEVQARTTADTTIVNNLAATSGAGTVGVITDANYTGLTVQAVLTNLAARIKTLTDAGSDSSGRLDDVEADVAALTTRVTHLETEDEEEVYEATGGETSYTFLNGKAQDKTVLVAINGQLQAPGINFVYLKDGSNLITGINFAPDTLKVTNGVPDVLLIKYKKIIT